MSNLLPRFFEYVPLSNKLLHVTNIIAKLAVDLDKYLPQSEEKEAGLRKLLEAREMFIRADTQITEKGSFR